MTLRTPNEMMAAAKEQMLEGREPTTDEDWVKVFNFLAANIAEDCEHSACRLFKMMYSAPISDEYIRQICGFQIAQKQEVSV